MRAGHEITRPSEYLGGMDGTFNGIADDGFLFSVRFRLRAWLSMFAEVTEHRVGQLDRPWPPAGAIVLPGARGQAGFRRRRRRNRGRRSWLSFPRKSGFRAPLNREAGTVREVGPRGAAMARSEATPKPEQLEYRAVPLQNRRSPRFARREWFARIEKRNPYRLPQSVRPIIVAGGQGKFYRESFQLASF